MRAEVADIYVAITGDLGTRGLDSTTARVIWSKTTVDEINQ
jgi:hypothetical protein